MRFTLVGVLVAFVGLAAFLGLHGMPSPPRTHSPPVTVRSISLAAVVGSPAFAWVAAPDGAGFLSPTRFWLAFMLEQPTGGSHYVPVDLAGAQLSVTIQPWDQRGKDARIIQKKVRVAPGDLVDVRCSHELDLGPEPLPADDYNVVVRVEGAGRSFETHEIFNLAGP